MARWVVIADAFGEYRLDLSSFLPSHGQRVLFETSGGVVMGTFHADRGGGFFRAAIGAAKFRVVSGAPAEVTRWLGAQ